jgi:hypothetical protein
MKGDGPMVVGLMWSMAVLCTFFTVLRTYTRTVIVKSFGADDIVFIVACVSCILTFMWRLGPNGRRDCLANHYLRLVNVRHVYHLPDNQCLNWLRTEHVGDSRRRYPSDGALLSDRTDLLHLRHGHCQMVARTVSASSRLY